MTHSLLRPLCFFLLIGTAATAVPSFSATGALPDSERSQAALLREQALALEHGEGVERDPERALVLYCQAAQAGDTAARYSLGWIYANGRGVPRNDGYAAYWFQLAAAQGDAPSRDMLQRLDTEPLPAPCPAPAAVTRVRVTLEGSAPGTAPAEGTARAASAKERQAMALVQRLAPEYGIHPELALAVIRAESGFNSRAVSGRNAQGLMQLIPATAARFQVRQPFDPEENIRGGLSYLRWLMAYFQGHVPLVLAAYNAGEGTVERYRGVPPYPETRGYIQRIQSAFDLARHPFDASVTRPSAHLPRILRK